MTKKFSQSIFVFFSLIFSTSMFAQTVVITLDGSHCFRSPGCLTCMTLPNEYSVDAGDVLKVQCGVGKNFSGFIRLNQEFGAPFQLSGKYYESVTDVKSKATVSAICHYSYKD